MPVVAMARTGRTYDCEWRDEIRTIEEVFARRYGGRHAWALNWGTSGLFAAYCSLGVGPVDRGGYQNLGEQIHVRVSCLSWLHEAQQATQARRVFSSACAQGTDRYEDEPDRM